MSTYNLTLDKDNTINISGYITFENIIDILNDSKKIIKNLIEIKIDFKNVLSINSCILIYILDCMKNAKKQNKKIIFKNIPPYLIELSKVYNLETTIK